MQDRDTPPQGEGNINGAVDGVRQDEARVARWAATARSSRAFLQLPWIIATAPIWAWTVAMATAAAAVGDRDGGVFRRRTRWPIRSLCQLQEKTPLRAFSHLSKTCLTGARFRPRDRR